MTNLWELWEQYLNARYYYNLFIESDSAEEVNIAHTYHNMMIQCNQIFEQHTFAVELTPVQKELAQSLIGYSENYIHDGCEVDYTILQIPTITYQHSQPFLVWKANSALVMFLDLAESPAIMDDFTRFVRDNLLAKIKKTMEAHKCAN